MTVYVASSPGLGGMSARRPQQTRCIVVRSLLRSFETQFVSNYKFWHFKELEWITSTRDLCQQMLTLGPHPSLTINPGLIQPSTDWEWVAFKGGSEPGVLNYTHLVQPKGKARRYCVSSFRVLCAVATHRRQGKRTTIKKKKAS